MQVLSSLIFYWLGINICLGYFVCQLFFRYFDTVNIKKKNILKSIQFRQKFTLTNLKKFGVNFISKFFENWFRRLSEKYSSLLRVFIPQYTEMRML